MSKQNLFSRLVTKNSWINSIPVHLGSFILIFIAASCAVGVVISMFGFSVDVTTLFVVWLSAGFLVTIFAAFWQGKGILVLILPSLVFLIWRLSEITQGARWIIHFISDEISTWFHSPVLFPGAEELFGTDPTLFFAALGVALIFALSYAICLRRSALITFVLTVPFLLLPLTLVYRLPNLWFLIGILAVYFILFISSMLYPFDVDKRKRSILVALPSALLLMGVTYIATPPDNYTRNEFARNLREEVRHLGGQAGIMRQSPGFGWPNMLIATHGAGHGSGQWRFNTEFIDIAGLGFLVFTDQSILEVTSSHSGTFYLRGHSMTEFDGRRWHAYRHSDPYKIEAEKLARTWPSAIVEIQHYSDLPSGAPNRVTMKIENIADRSSLIYLPYHTDMSDIDELAIGINFSYTVDFFYASPDFLELAKMDPATFKNYDLAFANATLREFYTGIDDLSAYSLRELAQSAGIDISAERNVVARQVADFVSSAAIYSPFFDSTPADEDFVLHFLQVSRQGFCIHYATAATMILRALDIPARFTSGFAFVIPQDKVNYPVVITDRNAHAWVEVYYDYIGWVPLEVTPGIFNVLEERERDYLEFEFIDGWIYGWIYGDEVDWINFQRGDYDFLQEAGSGTRLFNLDGYIISGVLMTILFCVVVGIIIGIAVCIIRRLILVRHRNRKFFQKDTNAAVISAWHYISRFAEGNKQPEEIEYLALKARFSPHRMADSERETIVAFARNIANNYINRYGVIKRFWKKYVLGF